MAHRWLGMRIVAITALASMIALVLAGPAASVSRAADQPPQKVPEADTPARSGSSTEPLSDKLDRSGGVIRPPVAVDPGMTQAPPAAGPHSTPVIPPPGTPGGKPGVEPK